MLEKTHDVFALQVPAMRGDEDIDQFTNDLY